MKTPTEGILRNRALRAEVRSLIEKGGVSSHSAMGLTLSQQLGTLERSKVPYTLKAMPGVGYVVEVPAPEDRHAF